MSKDNYFFRKSSFGVYLSPERKEIVDQNYETVFGTDADLKASEAFWILFETALNQNVARCNIKELEDLKNSLPQMQLELSDCLKTVEDLKKENELLKSQIEDLESNKSFLIAEGNHEIQKKTEFYEETVELKKALEEARLKSENKISPNQVLITFSQVQKALLDETRKGLSEIGVDYSEDEILARLFVDYTIKGPADYYPRVLKGARIKEIMSQFQEQK